MLLVSWGISAEATREARDRLVKQGVPVSLLVLNTLLPLPPVYREILRRYERVWVVEENLTGQLRELLAAHTGRADLRGIHRIGGMIAPDEIVAEVA